MIYVNTEDVVLDLRQHVLDGSSTDPASTLATGILAQDHVSASLIDSVGTGGLTRVGIHRRRIRLTPAEAEKKVRFTVSFTRSGRVRLDSP